MRNFMVFAFAMMVSVGFTADAEAGKKKGGDEPAAAAEETAPMMLNLDSGVASVDEIFKKAQAPMDSLNNAKMKLDAVPMGMNAALALPEGTPFKDAVADLKAKAGDKLTLAMDEGGIPKLALADGAPDNVKAAVDGLNASMNDAIGAVTALTEIPAQVQAVIAEAKSFDPKSIKPVTAIPGATKAIAGNLKMLTGAPDQVTALGESLNNIKKELLAGING